LLIELGKKYLTEFVKAAELLGMPVNNCWLSNEEFMAMCDAAAIGRKAQRTIRKHFLAHGIHVLPQQIEVCAALGMMQCFLLPR